MNIIGNNIYINQNVNYLSIKTALHMSNTAIQSIVSFQVLAEQKKKIPEVKKMKKSNHMDENNEHEKEKNKQFVYIKNKRHHED